MGARAQMRTTILVLALHADQCSHSQQELLTRCVAIAANSSSHISSSRQDTEGLLPLPSVFFYLTLVTAHV